MPNLFDSALSALISGYQSITTASPTVGFGEGTIPCIPAGIILDPMFVDGGVGEGGQIVVQTRSAAWVGVGTAPEKGDVVTLAGHPNAADGTYHVLKREDKEANILLTLGNFDAQ